MISISGVRGVVGESLTPDVVVQYASSFAELCGPGKTVLGRDGRATGKIIANIAASTLLSMGRDVVALGVCPTPTIQLAVEDSDAVGGIAVTASHNPAQWNGLKFIDGQGLSLDADGNRRLQDVFAHPTRRYARMEKIGTHITGDYIQKHVDRVVGLPYINIEQIRKRQFKVVADCINAAGGVIVPKLLGSLGCRVVEMNCDVSGVFSRTPEPVPENLGEACARVRQEKADLGVVVDPDADRLVLITEQGEPFGEEYTIASVVSFILSKSKPPATVVVNLSTTRAIDDIARHYGAQVIRTPVGEINVAKKMKEIGSIVGGEGSGGVILPAVHYGRDAIVGIGLVVQMLAEFDGTLSELKSTLPKYSTVKNKIDLGGIDSGRAMERVMSRHGTNGSLNTEDGVKIDFADSWVHLRKSNTEPIIRIIAEAPTYPQAEALVRQFQQEIMTSSR